MARKPVVLFVSPDKYAIAYAGIANKLSAEALWSVGGTIDDINLMGYVSLNAEYAAATLHFLTASGIQPYDVVALILFGEAAEQFRFDTVYADECSLGTVIIPGISASFPTLCVPSIETGWYKEPDQWNQAKDTYLSLLQNGRKALVGGEPYNFVVRSNATWN